MRVVLALLLAVAALCLPVESDAQNTDEMRQADEEAIQDVIQTLDDAWNRGDGRGWAEHYKEDGEFINILGTIFDGREAVANHHSEILSSTFKGSVVESQLRRVRWIGSDAAVVDTDFYVRNFERLPRRLSRIWPDGSMRHRLKHIMWKRDGRWLIVATQNTPLMPPRS
jgi:uncharacterized protein (TIGR02246 family)